MLQVVPQGQQRANLAALVATGAPLDGAKVRLINARARTDPFVTWGDLTETTFPGYAVSATIVWGAPYNTPDGGAAVVGQTCQFTLSGSPGDTILGYAITTGAGPGFTLLKYTEFDAPVLVTRVGDAVVVEPVYELYPAVPLE